MNFYYMKIYGVLWHVWVSGMEAIVVIGSAAASFVLIN